MFAEKVRTQTYRLIILTAAVLMVLSLAAAPTGAFAAPLRQGQSDGDLTFDCSGTTAVGALEVSFPVTPPGSGYEVTVIGLDGFDPLLAMWTEDGSTSRCNDDDTGAMGTMASLPDTGLVEADMFSSQLTFDPAQLNGALRFGIGRFGSTGGRYIAIFTGLSISPSTEQDTVSFDVSSAVEEDPLLVYMIAQTADLDSYMTLQGTEIVCDDVNVGPCADIPPFSTSQDNADGVSLANGSQYVAWQYDAGIRVIPAETGDPTFVFSSYAGRSEGNYAMIVVGYVPGEGLPAAQTGIAAQFGLTGQPSQQGQADQTGQEGQQNEPSSGAASIAYGDTVQGTIDDTQYSYRYVFTGARGDTVTITMEAGSEGNLDTLLALFDLSNPDPNADPVSLNDDYSQGNYNSQLVYTLPNDGQYEIFATRFQTSDGTTSGPFTLTLELGVNEQNQGIGVGGPLSYGATVQGIINDQIYGYGYPISAEAGDSIVATVEAGPDGNLDPILSLFSPSDPGTMLAINNDISSTDYNAQIQYTFPTGGPYYLGVVRMDGDAGTTSGSFTLTLELVGTGQSADNAPVIAYDARPVAYGDTVQDTITHDRPSRYYYFTAQEGDEVTITMEATGGDLDPMLSLYDSNNFGYDGYPVTMGNDMTPDTLNARIVYTIPADGTYLIQASRLYDEDGTTTGDFTMTLEGVSMSGSGATDDGKSGDAGVTEDDKGGEIGQIEEGANPIAESLNQASTPGSGAQTVE